MITFLILMQNLLFFSLFSLRSPLTVTAFIEGGGARLGAAGVTVRLQHNPRQTK